MVYSRRSLGTKELADFLAIDIEQHRYDNESRLMDSSDIFVLCPNLITVDTYAGESVEKRRGEPVKFVHFSVKEYLLLSKAQAVGPAARIPFAAEVHGRIAEMCLIYLIENIKPMKRVLNKDLIKNRRDWPRIRRLERLEESFPLAEYAAESWRHHARSADPGNLRLNGLILTFLQSKAFCTTWLKLLCNGMLRVDTDPLYNASAAGLTQIVQEMLSQGANVHRISDDEAALSVASLNGHRSVIQVLIDHGAQINGPSRRDCALTYAARNGHLECVKLLLAHGADIEGGGGNDPTSPLHIALIHHHLEVA